MKTRYTIIANPVSGPLPLDEKRRRLHRAAKILGAELHGLDSASAGDLDDCARRSAPGCDVLVIAGGDGTFSSVINAMGPYAKPVAFLPLGTGNALARAVGSSGDMDDAARGIRDGRVHAGDLIRCDGKRLAFMASIGFDAAAVVAWDRIRKGGAKGFSAYFKGMAYAYFRGYRPGRVHVDVDGRRFVVRRLMSLVVVKQPYYGFGLKIVPRASWNDGRLHVNAIPAGLLNAAGVVATGFTIGNRIGRYASGKRVAVYSERPLSLQTDGNIGWKGTSFSFEVLPGALKMKY